MIELGEFDGISAALAPVTCVVARSRRLACGEISVALVPVSALACGFAL